MTRLAALLCLLAWPAWGSELRVVDGDTIVLDGERIRLEGIDAPESKQWYLIEDRTYPCGQEATKALQGLLAGAVTCLGEKVDRYGRRIAVCYAGGIDVNGRMVSDGWALAYRKYSTAYVQEENSARVARQGMWAGKFEKPWEWRRRN